MIGSAEISCSVIVSRVCKLWRQLFVQLMAVLKKVVSACSRAAKQRCTRSRASDHMLAFPQAETTLLAITTSRWYALAS